MDLAGQQTSVKVQALPADPETERDHDEFRWVSSKSLQAYAAFFAVATCVCATAIWQLMAARRLSMA